jgi:uncharacterized membrane protein YhhN
LGIALAAGAAGLYALLPALDPELHAAPAAVALKAAAILALAALAVAARPRAPLLAAALVAHTAGDVLIETAPFVLAMAAFGAGHLLYVRLFWPARRPWEDVRGGAKLTIGALALAGALLLHRLVPGLQPVLAAAVPLYAVALLAMAAVAQLTARGRPWVPLGALLFVASDSVLALDRFVGPLEAARWIVWPAYWLGQAAIVLGWLPRGVGRN